MNLELTLLILESVLLAFTVVLLLFSIREGRSREKLIRGVDKAAKTFTRLEYFLAVVDSMSDAKVEIAGLITGRPPSGSDIKRSRDIIDAIEKMSKSQVRIRYLLPQFHDRLHIGYLYSKAGAQIRFSTCPILHDLRYMTVDEGVTIIGIPESVGQKEATKKGYKIASEGLNSILKEHFESCWAAAVPYEEYLKEVISRTKATARHLSKELNIDEAELERFY